MVQFGVAYYVMLLAMYYNGYFVTCIIIDAFLFFHWESVSQGTWKQVKDRHTQLIDEQCCKEEVTVCCGRGEEICMKGH
jgi:hypothetical protein